MRLVRSIIAVLVLFATCGTALQTTRAHASDDLLLFMPVFAYGQTAMIKSVARKHVILAESQVDFADLVSVAVFISGYPPGTAPAEIVVDPADGSWTTNIGSVTSAAFALGLQAVTQDSRTVALWCFAGAVGDDPTNPVYVNSLAFELIEHGYLDDAEKLLRWVVNKEPEFAEAKVNLAFILGERGKHMEAGQLYQEAAVLDPFDSHAMYAAAREYKQAGVLDLAWEMAGLGEDTFPTHFDFAGFLAGLGYPPQPGACSPPVCQSQACWDVFANWGDELGAKLLPVLNNYDTNVADPAATENYQLLVSLRAKATNHRQTECPKYFSPYYDICICEAEKSYAEARLIYDKRTYWQDIKDLGFRDRSFDAAWSRIMGYYTQRAGEMAPGESQAMACWLDAQRMENKQDRANERRLELASDLEAMQTAATEIAVVAQVYCDDSIYYVWAFTIEPVVGLEPKYCTGPVCVSKDGGSGDEAIEMSFGPSIKFARNPHTGRGSITVGLGHSVGVATHNYGAAIQATIGGDKVGIVGKVSAGWVDGGIFVGLKRQRTNWSSYNN